MVDALRLASAVAPAPFKKAVGVDLLPAGLPHRAAFQLAVDAGFDAVEMRDVADREEAEEVREAAVEVGVAIHSVGTYAHNWHPLSSPDPAEVRKGVGAIRTALGNAHLWGAGTLLLNPAVVDAQTSYGEAWARSQAVIRSEILPLAEELRIVIGIENVWTGFLLSPLDYVRYIDELDSPWVRAYLDVGNPIFGCPEHWVRIAGHRLVKLHVKDLRFDRAHGRFFFAKIGQGDIDWAALRAALLDVGFCGYMTNTSIPRSRLIRGMARGVRLLNGAAHGTGIGRAVSALRHPADIRFLRDVSRRFDEFRDGGLFQ